MHVESKTINLKEVLRPFMQKNMFIFLSFFLSVLPVRAQEEQSFRDYLEHSSVAPGLYFPVFSFYVGTPDLQGKAYVPNFAPRANLNLNYKDVGIGIGIALPIPKEEIDRRGETHQVSFIINKYWRRSALDLYYQSYHGFYAGNPVSEVDINKPSRYAQFPDAESKNYGINFYQVLGQNPYGFRSAFAYKERQLSSGGSWIGYGFYNHVDISLGQKFIRGTDGDFLQSMPVFKAISLETLGGGGGYGYTWVIDDWATTAQAIGAIGLQTKDAGYSNYQTAALKGNINLSTAYLFESSVLGARLLIDSLYSVVNQDQIYSTMGELLIFYRIRF